MIEEIKEFVEQLAAAGLDLGASDLRDAFWLAEHIRTVDAEPIAIAPEGHATTAIAEKPTNLPEQAAAEPAEAPLIASPSIPIFAEGTEQSVAWQRGIGFRSPAVPALRDQLGFTRALRAFGRRVPSRTAVLIDEAETVRRIAEEELWEPAVRPATEPWLSLTLLLDTSASMAVWQQTVAQFRALTEWLGIFSEVRVHEFDATKSVGVADKWFSTRTGRLVVLVISDLLGGVWQDGTMDAVLREIGRSVPVAVLTLLPQRMWEGTGVDVSSAEVSAVWPGDCNAAWRCDSAPVPIPLLECAPAWVARWTDIVTASPGSHRIALLDTPPAPPRLTVATAPAPPPARDAAELIDRFRMSASPYGFRLCCYLSATILSLPVMRLIQRVMLPSSDVTHLAEVFLSGLLLRWEGQSTPELVEYDFLPGVREELNSYLLRDDALTILRETGEFVTEHLGQAFDFGTLLEDPEGAEIPIHGGELGGPPLAVIAATVLARMGGRYAILADRIAAAGKNRPGRNEVIDDAVAEHEAVGNQPTDPRVETRSLRIGLVDDHIDALSEILRGLFERFEGAELSAHATTTDGLLAITDDLDLVIMDLHGSPDGASPGRRVEHIRGAGIENILIYSGKPSWRSARAAIDNGARGVLAKTRSLEKLMEAIRVCASGRHYPSVEWARAVESLTATDLLTWKERRILVRFTADPDPMQVASEFGIPLDELFTAVGTINDKCRSIYPGREAESWFVAAVGLASGRPRRFANVLNSLMSEGDYFRIRTDLRAPHDSETDDELVTLRIGIYRTPPVDLIRALTEFFGARSRVFYEENFVEADEPLRFELLDLSVADSALRILRRRAESELEPAYRLELARALSDFAGRWWSGHDQAKSVAATEEAAGIFRTFARTHVVELARTLVDLGERKTLLGDAEGSIEATREVVSVCRQLSILVPDGRHFDLVGALNGFGQHLVRLGRRTEGLDVALAGVAVMRQLAGIDPADGVESDFPRILQELGALLVELGRQSEAVEAAREAVSITERLASADPDTYLPLLVRALHSFGTHLEKSGRLSEAVVATQQAVDVARHAAYVAPSDCLPELVDALQDSALRFSRAGHLAEAVEAAREAVAVARRLASAEPEVYLTGLIDALRNAAVQCSRAGHLAEAIQATQEAESVTRKLRATHPTVHMPEPTRGFDSLRIRLEESGNRSETLGVTRDAVSIVRQMVATNPAYLPALAHELNTLGIQLDRAGHRPEALDVTREAVAVTRALKTSDSHAYAHDVARALYRLAGLCDRESLHDDALGYALESVDLFRTLSEDEPASYERELVLALDITAIQFGALRQRDHALAAAEEALEICERLDDIDLLIHARSALADILDAMGRAEAAAEIRPKNSP